jgi:hypothetical protein
MHIISENSSLPASKNVANLSQSGGYFQDKILIYDTLKKFRSPGNPQSYVCSQQTRGATLSGSQQRLHDVTQQVAHGVLTG